MANRLGSSASPYLQQHADNPVHWWEWSDEAFAEARRRDVPVLLSVGYSACHWCHVMAHESFEDPGTARLINENFVAIKVDREERPDIDAIYLRATQMLTSHGGWPNTVFLDPAGRPFHAGTYFPPEDRHGMPSFQRVLRGVAAAWRSDRVRVDDIAARLTEAIQASDQAPQIIAPPEVLAALATDSTQWRDLSDEAVAILKRAFDPRAGGFGGAPKFPPSMVLEFLLRHHARTGEPDSLAMVEKTATAMARGGIYDQLGGGFARYSTDASWVVPHFEKMLSDNALLARVYLHWWRATGNPLAEQVTRQTCDFLLAELQTEQGGFASALDADSTPTFPGQNPEGAFYVWRPEEVGQEWADVLSVTKAGTFEHGTSVLQMLADPPAGWPTKRAELLAQRANRARPARDDKIVAGWNGLAVAALAEASVLLSDRRYLDAAIAAASLIDQVHRRDDLLLRVSRDGVAGDALGVLADYGGVAVGWLALYQATGIKDWLAKAEALIATAVQEFRTDGQFYETGVSSPPLLTRLQDTADNATPAGWTLITDALLTVAALTGDVQTRLEVEESLAALLETGAARQPQFFGWGLSVLEAAIAGPKEVAIVGPDTTELQAVAWHGTSPGLVIACGEPGEDYPALLRDRRELRGLPTAYVCSGFVCQAPTTEPTELARLVT